jgi:hypothetical protein
MKSFFASRIVQVWVTGSICTMHNNNTMVK